MSNLILTKSRFVHIPKCAGTFAQAAMHRLHLVTHRYKTPHCGHLCLHQMPETDDFNFAFVRHPYTWWPSYYYYMNRNSSNVVPFDEWLHDEGPFWVGHYTTLIKRFVGIDPVYPTSNKIHFVGKTENIEQDLLKALQQAGETVDGDLYEKILAEQHTEVGISTKWGNIQQYERKISDASKRLIHAAEAWVFDEFDYSE